MKPITPEQKARRKERDAASYLLRKALKPPTIKKKPGPVAKAKPAMPQIVRVAAPSKRGPGPAHLPGPPIITEHTRYVVGTSPPQSYRTNTFSMT